MIRGIFHKGSGLGNQLHRYVGAKVLALESGQEFGMVAPDLFKGSSFMKLDMGNTLSDYHIEEPSGKVIPHTTDPIIDGEFQGEQYFINHLDKIREWLKVEPIEADVCVINFRGGEYAGVPELFLPKEYWDRAIEEMRTIKPDMRFQVHTDDPHTATQFFPDFECIKDIGINWRTIQYANYLILSNSSFAILPAHLNENVKKIIAPLYWAGYNVGQWKMPENEYKKFTYI